MASIEERKCADGSTAYKAEIVIRVDGKRRKKSATFDRAITARAWAAKMERQLKSNDIEAFQKREPEKTIGDLIQLYLDDIAGSDIGKTKRQVLCAIKREYDISDTGAEKMTSYDVTRFARQVAQGRAPSTVMNYLQHLYAVVRSAKAGFGIEANKSAMSKGIEFCVKEGSLKSATAPQGRGD
ncbi:MAG: hypothetical protein AAFQ58_00390 [Pseudomonadota bacterium]